MIYSIPLLVADAQRVILGRVNLSFSGSFVRRPHRGRVDEAILGECEVLVGRELNSSLWALYLQVAGLDVALDAGGRAGRHLLAPRVEDLVVIAVARDATGAVVLRLDQDGVARPVVRFDHRQRGRAGVFIQRDAAALS